MFGNADNSSIEINVDKGGNGMSKGTVSIDISEYKEILELAYKAAILKDALFGEAVLGYDGKSLTCGFNGDAGTVAKYLFPEEYAEKLAELVDEKRAKDIRDKHVELMNKKKKEEDSKEDGE